MAPVPSVERIAENRIPPIFVVIAVTRKLERGSCDGEICGCNGVGDCVGPINVRDDFLGYARFVEIARVVRRRQLAVLGINCLNKIMGSYRS